jgi:hypothetical protein
VSERLPTPDSNRFPDLDDAHVRILGEDHLLGRIHATSGRHPSRWNEFRYWGPTKARFDHQPPPARIHPSRGVYYAAPTLRDRKDQAVPILRTCIAEVFRDRGVIELSRDDPYFVLFRTVRPLRLLDVADSDWISLAGGNASISSGLRSTARDWSRAVYRTYKAADAVDGIHYTCSNVPVGRSVFLFERAEDALPPRPQAHLPLTHPALRPEIEAYASQLDLFLVP